MPHDFVLWEFFLGGIFTCTIILGPFIAYRQRLRTALHESEERFRAVSTASCDWEILLGTDGHPFWVNTAAQQMSGLKNEEALALPDYPLPLVDQEYQAAVRSSLLLVEQGGIIDDQLIRVRRPDNSSYWGSLSAQKIFSSKGKFLGSRLSIRDVSALIAYQEAVGHKKQLLQSVLDNTSDGIIALNQELRVIFFNTRFLQLWGLNRAFLNEQPTLQEMIHEVCRVGLYPPAEAEALIKRRIEHLNSVSDQIILETPRQDGVLVEGFAAPLPGIGYLLTYRDVTVQTLATCEAQRSREHYRTLIETVPHGIIECDLSGRIRYANTSYGAIVGIAPELLQERFFWDALSTPEAAGMMKKRFEQIRDEGYQPGTQIVRMVNNAGTSLWRQIDWDFLRDVDAQPSGYIAVVTDITERKNAQAMLDDERFFLNTLIQSLPDPVWLKDINGIFLTCNAAFSQIFNDIPTNIIGRKDNDYVDDELAAFFQQKDREALTASRPVTNEEWVTYASDGHRALWETTKTRIVDMQGQVVGALGIARDITERKAAEKKEREQATFVQTILDSVPAPIFYKDCDGRYLGCNTAFERYLGRSRAEVIGSSVFDLAPPDLAKVYADSDAELLRKGGTQSYETQVLFADGRFHNVLFCKAILPGEDGTARGLVGTMIDISDRKEAEDALFQSERKFRAIFDQAFQYSAILDPTGRIQEINQAALTSIDSTLPEVYGKFFWEAPWWQGSVEEQEKIRNAITSCSWGNTLHFETRHIHPNGYQTAVDFSIKPVRDEWGQIIYLIPEGRDISKLKRREEMAMLMARGISAPTGGDFFPALAKSLVEVLGADHAYIGTVEGEEISVLAGISNGVETVPWRFELSGTPCAEVLSKGQICAFPQRVQILFPSVPLLQSLAVEGYVGGALCAANGTPLGIMAVLYAQPIKDRGLAESLLKIFVARAASELERRQADAILQQNEVRYRELSNEFETIFNGIPDSLTVWSSEMNLLWANSSSTSHYGVSVKDLAGKSCQDICTFHFVHDPDCEIRRCLTSGKTDERIRKALDGRSWGIKTFPLHNPEGKVDRIIRVASDLTERMLLREEAARAAHLAALGELAAGMAHEINNPTSLILLVMPVLQEVFSGISEILDEHFLVHGDFSCGGLRYSKMRAELPEMIEDVLDGAARIKHIVAELKDFSHPIESNKFKAVDLNEVVRKSLSLVGSQIKKATDHFTVTYAPVAPQTSGSAQRLEQVVINLLINACQALPDRKRSLSVETGTWPERGRHFIRVADSGTGILPEHLQLITDPFFTTRRATGGTGLGLSVSSRIIEEHGGTLHFASAAGEGTTVTIELPLAAKEDSK